MSLISRKSMLYAIILTLVLLNALRWLPESNTRQVAADVEIAIQVSTELPQLHLPRFNEVRAADSQRDIFAFATPQNLTSTPPAPSAPVAPTVQPGIAADPREARIAAVERDMQNTRVRGILSSPSGLNAIIESPFYSGPVEIGQEMANGVSIGEIRADRVEILHLEFALKREILVE